MKKNYNMLEENDGNYYSVYCWSYKIEYYRTSWCTLEMAVQEAEKLALYLNLRGHGFLEKKDLRWMCKNKEIIRIEKQNFYTDGVDKNFGSTGLPNDWARNISALYEPGGSIFIQSQENIENLIKFHYKN